MKISHPGTEVRTIQKIMQEDKKKSCFLPEAVYTKPQRQKEKKSLLRIKN
jgi:hypothetical protein